MRDHSCSPLRKDDERPGARLLAFHEPNEIAAGIVEVGKLRWPHGFGLVSEHSALGPQAIELRGDVVGVELRQRNAIVVKRLLQRACRRMTGRFKQKLDAIGIVGRDEREPGGFAKRNVMFDAKAEHVTVEAAGAVLVVDQNAHQLHAYHGASWFDFTARSWLASLDNVRHWLIHRA